MTATFICDLTAFCTTSWLAMDTVIYGKPLGRQFICYFYTYGPMFLQSA